MKLQHKIKSYFKTHDFHLWKDLRLGEGLYFVYPNDEILVGIAAYLRDDIKTVTTLEDRRFRLKKETALSFDSIDELLPWLFKILKSDFDETMRESEIFGWDFQYQLKPHRTSENSISLVNVLTSKKKQSHCVYTLATLRKFDAKFYCWIF